MAIALSIDYPGMQKEGALVPVAGQQSFTTYWVPACKALGLRWIPLFGGGLPVNLEDIPDITGELNLLRQFITSKPPPQMPEDVARSMLEAIDGVSGVLSALQELPSSEAQHWEAYIG